MGKTISKEVKKGVCSRDISLLVSDETQCLHTLVIPKALLLHCSPVFRDMALTGALKKGKKLKLAKVSLVGLLKILEYLENEGVEFEALQEATEAFKGAGEYQIDGVQNVCLEYLHAVLDTTNVCEIYEFAITAVLPNLIYKCLKIIDENTGEVLKSSCFNKLSQSTVVEIIKRNTLSVSSEMAVFDAVLKWGESECIRRGLEHEDTSNFRDILKLVLTHVRFANMSQEDLSDPNVSDFYDSLSGKQGIGRGSQLYPIRSNERDSPANVRESVLGLATGTENNIADEAHSNSQSRLYLEHYSHRLDVFDSTQPSISKGETFCLTIEILKGKVYLCGVDLAIKAMSSTKAATCLYAVICVTNTSTAEQQTVWGTFLNTNDVPKLMLSKPLFLKANETAEIALNVKMAENVCPLARRNDVEIVVPDLKDIAMKILPNSSTKNYVRCIFKDLIYFF